MENFTHWAQAWAVAGFVCLIVEIFVPTMVALNLAIGAFFTAVFAYFFPGNPVAQTAVFAAASLFSILVFRPLMVKRKHAEEHKMPIQGKYIGERAQVMQKIGEAGTDGVGKIKIYGEIWDAKSEDDSVIEPFEMVTIVRNDSLLMFVQKQGE